MWGTSAAVTVATLYWKLGTLVVVVAIVVGVVVDVEVVVEVEVVVGRWLADRDVWAELDLLRWAAPFAPHAATINALAATIVGNQPIEGRPGKAVEARRLAR